MSTLENSSQCWLISGWLLGFLMVHHLMMTILYSYSLFLYLLFNFTHVLKMEPASGSETLTDTFKFVDLPPLINNMIIVKCIYQALNIYCVSCWFPSRTHTTYGWSMAEREAFSCCHKMCVLFLRMGKGGVNLAWLMLHSR